MGVFFEKPFVYAVYVWSFVPCDDDDDNESNDDNDLLHFCCVGRG